MTDSWRGGTPTGGGLGKHTGLPSNLNPIWIEAPAPIGPWGYLSLRDVRAEEVTQITHLQLRELIFGPPLEETLGRTRWKTLL